MSRGFKKILVLGDGVTGHARQVEAVLSQIKEVYRGRGVAETDVFSHLLTLDVKFKRSFIEKIIFYLNHPFFKNCPGCDRCLRFRLSDKDFECLSGTSADVVVSAFGRKTVEANLWVSKKSGAKSVVVMTPRARLAEFDLAIVPRHDGLEARRNVVITEGAPNLMHESLLCSEAAKLENELGALSSFRVGFLVGGDYKDFHMTGEKISAVLGDLEEATRARGGHLLVTTSRRTPRLVKELLKARLSNNPLCRLLVIADEKNRPGTVPAILGLCQVVVVSPESVSMISEAASSAAHVIVFEEDTFVRGKHRAFLENLKNRGHIEILGTGAIRERIRQYPGGVQKTRPLDDRTVVRQALEALV